MNNYNKINKLLKSFNKIAQTITHTDPVYDKLISNDLGPGTVQNNPALMRVVQDMASNGVPPNKTFDIGLAINANKVPIYTVSPPNQIVSAAFTKHITPLIRKVIANENVDNFVINQWIRDLYWES